MMLLLFSACRTASVVDACDLDDSLCLSCASDAACGYTGNACTDTVYCAHQDAEITVVEIGCDPAVEYAWPADDTCRCVASACTAAD